MTDAVAQMIFNAASVFGIYGLAVLGFLLLYSVRAYFNFLAGIPVVLAPYASIWLVGSGVELGTAVAVAVMGVAALGGATYLLSASFPRVHRQPTSTLLIASLGIYTAVAAAIALAFGQQAMGLSGSDLRVFSFPFSVRGSLGQCAAIMLAILLIPLFSYVWIRSIFGVGLRAAADSSALAEIIGVPVRRHCAVAFSAGFALLGMAGLLQAVDTSVRPDFGFSLVVVAMIAVAAGAQVARLGSALLCAAMVAAAEGSVGWFWGEQWARGVALSLLLVLLLLRGRAARTEPRQV